MSDTEFQIQESIVTPTTPETTIAHAIIAEGVENAIETSKHVKKGSSTWIILGTIFGIVVLLYLISSSLLSLYLMFKPKA
jgi:uncharacterized membrane protein HdeD (DUF308 family)